MECLYASGRAGGAFNECFLPLWKLVPEIWVPGLPSFLHHQACVCQGCFYTILYRTTSILLLIIFKTTEMHHYQSSTASTNPLQANQNICSGSPECLTPTDDSRPYMFGQNKRTITRSNNISVHRSSKIQIPRRHMRPSQTPSGSMRPPSLRLKTCCTK